MASIPEYAPVGNPVLYRTYSRRKDIGGRESLDEIIDRNQTGLAELGKFTEEEAQLCRDMHEQLVCLPSGRWHWVGGTKWLKKPTSFYGSYNCSSLDIQEWEDFAMAMDLLMQGTGMGGNFEFHNIEQLPIVCNKLNINIKDAAGDKQSKHSSMFALEDTKLIKLDDTHYEVVVGDSRKGWRDSLLHVLELSSMCGDSTKEPSKEYIEQARAGEPREITIDVYLCNVRPAGSVIKGFGGISNPTLLPQFYGRVAKLLNKCIGRQLTSVECALLYGEIGLLVVSGNVRRCLPENALVHTIKGLVPIKDVKVGTSVWTPIGYRKVTAKFYQGTQDVVELVTDSALTRATLNHRVAVLEDESGNYIWKQVKHLVEGDILLEFRGKCGKYTAGNPVVFKKLGNVSEEYTYDIEVEEAHCFYFDGYLGHNSAEMIQASSDDAEFINAKDNLWTQDSETGKWRVDPEKDGLRMGNHTRVFRKKPTLEECIESVTKQFYSGEGAIQWAGESIYRANVDYIDTPALKKVLFEAIEQGRPAVEKLFLEFDPDMDDYELNHRMNRVSLNPCFAAGTMVLTKQGHFPIEELVGRQVEVWDGEAWRTIDNFRVTGINQEVWKLTISRGEEIFATPYHKFILENGERVELKDLKPGDELMQTRASGLIYPMLIQSVLVVSIEPSHIAPEVYCCTVPDTHSFTLANGLSVGNCGEILGKDFLCVSGNTMLIHKQGMRPIEQLVGQSIDIWNGEQWSTVIPTVTGYNRELFRVKFGDGTYLDVTENHKWLVKDRFQSSYREVPTSELMSVSKYSVHTKPFSMSYDTPAGTVISDSDIKYWHSMGFSVGDGTLTKQGYIVCTLHNAKRDVELVGSRRDAAYKNVLGTVYDHHTIHDPYLVGFRKAEAGLKQGLTDGLLDIFDNLSKLPRELILAFISGWIDADGSLTESGGVRLYISDYYKAYLAYLLLVKCGIRSSVNLSSPKGSVTNKGTRSRDLYYLQITDCKGLIYTQRVDTSLGHVSKSKGKWQVVKSVEKLDGLHTTYCFEEHQLHQAVFGGTLTKQCNLAEIHLNQIDPLDYSKQHDAFKAGALTVAGLLHHRFHYPKYQASREIDPIVGVSFTGLFDFFVNLIGLPWLLWWKEGRPAKWGPKLGDVPHGDERYECDDAFWSVVVDLDLDDELTKGEAFKLIEEWYLTSWKDIVGKEVEAYCIKHNLKVPNRFTTVQPSGSKSLLTNAAPGWHPPKSIWFTRRVTFQVNDPVALACIDYGYNVVPSQTDKDENGNLLDDPFDSRVTEWLVEIPTKVTWAQGRLGELVEKYEIHPKQFSALAQFDFYMQVQNHYVTHNTSATIELREDEIVPLATAIYENIQNDGGYMTAALLSRFDAPYPRLPFEDVTKAQYELDIKEVESRRKSPDFLELLKQYDTGWSQAEGPATCDSDKCLFSEVTK